MSSPVKALLGQLAISVGRHTNLKNHYAEKIVGGERVKTPSPKFTPRHSSLPMVFPTATLGKI
jgi:hypothetical protein